MLLESYSTQSFPVGMPIVVRGFPVTVVPVMVADPGGFDGVRWRGSSVYNEDTGWCDSVVVNGDADVFVPANFTEPTVGQLFRRMHDWLGLSGFGFPSDGTVNHG